MALCPPPPPPWTAAAQFEVNSVIHSCMLNLASDPQPQWAEVYALVFLRASFQERAAVVFGWCWKLDQVKEREKHLPRLKLHVSENLECCSMRSVTVWKF